ncbi:hypothetical protein PROFUN_01911 [Planoprotostelium fungivorum]|uniref:Uncharacterized protein n=1 Tax=Planoprotostelium fungivorum TaxID=1890364 RepID=A0A2P6NZ07_9EUKA|nr:hypothetical protein PROFUN_01911 [Planoprotostelium fungivorum]
MPLERSESDEDDIGSMATAPVPFSWWSNAAVPAIIVCGMYLPESIPPSLSTRQIEPRVGPSNCVAASGIHSGEWTVDHSEGTPHVFCRVVSAPSEGYGPAQKELEDDKSVLFHRRMLDGCGDGRSFG